MLADPSSAGATYLDLRVPERVAAAGSDRSSTEPDADRPPQTLNLE